MLSEPVLRLSDRFCYFNCSALLLRPWAPAALAGLDFFIPGASAPQSWDYRRAPHTYCPARCSEVSRCSNISPLVPSAAALCTQTHRHTQPQGLETLQESTSSKPVPQAKCSGTVDLPQTHTHQHRPGLHVLIQLPLSPKCGDAPPQWTSTGYALPLTKGPFISNPSLPTSCWKGP